MVPASASMAMGSPSRTAAMGPPLNASGTTWATMKPCVAPLKRPSVTSATVSESPSPTMAPVTPNISRIPGAFADDGSGDAQHLAHTRTAPRAFVADDHHVAGLDPPAGDGAHGVLFAVEHARGAAVLDAFVAGELDDAAIRRERSAQNGHASARLEGLRERAHDFL